MHFSFVSFIITHMKEKILGIIRICLGWVFFWAFTDKTFGLGFATESSRSWVNGGSPTEGFLKFGTKGPFADFYQGLAGNPIVDWLFMIGLLFIGLSLIFGIGIRIASYSGALMLVLMYTAGFILPENNPLIDDHIIYALVLIYIAHMNAGDYLGFGKKWSNTKLVKNNNLLK